MTLFVIQNSNQNKVKKKLDIERASGIGYFNFRPPIRILAQLTRDAARDK
jgi:hypothetical protein